MAVPDGVVRFPHAASPRARLAAVDVERGLVGAAVTLRTRLVLVLEHLDTCNIQRVNINININISGGNIAITGRVRS